MEEIPKPDDAPQAYAPEERVKQVKLPLLSNEVARQQPLIHEVRGSLLGRKKRGRMFVVELHGYKPEGFFFWGLDVQELNKTGELTHDPRIQAARRDQEKSSGETLAR